MARTAEAQGVPESAIFVEPSARDTIQNACFATRIMEAHGWTSAEVVSSPSHLPRAAQIFSRLPIERRTHAAPSLEAGIGNQPPRKLRHGNVEDPALPGVGSVAGRMPVKRGLGTRD